MNAESKHLKRARRQLRLSLKSTLILVICLCVWLSWYVHRAERQKKAVAWVRENGGAVFYDYEIDSNGDINADRHRPAPAWLLNIFGVDFFATPVQVTFMHRAADVYVSPPNRPKNFDDFELLGRGGGYFLRVTDVSPLADLTGLKVLSLSRSGVSDLTPLRSLKSLEVLYIRQTLVNDLTPLKSLTNLKRLELRHSDVNDVTPLTGLNKLELLDIQGTKASRREINELELALPDCQIFHDFN